MKIILVRDGEVLHETEVENLVLDAATSSDIETICSEIDAMLEKAGSDLEVSVSSE